MGVLVREVGALYEAYERGEESPLEELEVQYGDYAVWQRERLKGEELERELRYWREQLRGAPAVLELPTDRVRPAIESFKGARLAFRLPAALSESLRRLSREEGATLYMVLLGAFSVLLWRYSGAEDVVVGTPVANRTRGEVEGLIGFFVNTLVMRVEVRGEESYRELVRRVREVSVGGYGHQEVPFEKVVEELTPERSLSHTPLFQVMFALQNFPLKELELSELTFTSLNGDDKTRSRFGGGENHTAKFDLTLFTWEDMDVIAGSVEYNTDLFDASTITRMMGHFETLLEDIVAHPEKLVRNLSLLSESERHQQLVEWNDTRTNYALDKCVHQLFEIQAEREPEAIALSFEDQHLTYGELNRRANKLARYLQKLGVEPEMPVGICMERSAEMVLGLLAALKAGGAVVALDPTYPKERLAFMIEDARMSVLLAQERTTELLPKGNVRTVCLDSDWHLIAREDDDNPSSAVTSGNLVYTIYTSGSTGLPKGVGMSHRAFLNLLYWQYHQSALSQKARTMQFATFGFCVSFQEVFSTFLSGGTLVLVSEATRRDVDGLVDFLENNAIERLHLPFASLKHLAEASCNSNKLPTRLREIITAGEQLQITPSINTLLSRLQDCSLHNQYGASETHVVTSCSLFGSPDDWPAIPPIGRPIANTQIYLLDNYLQPVPIGVIGTVYVGGECLTRAYQNDPALTAEKYLPNPFTLLPGARLYRTGDLARFLPDGSLLYLGRADSQVKIRGYRIELGEVEAVLSQHPGVREVAVTAREDETGNKALVAYLVAETEHRIETGEVRSYLKERLPEYMIPSAFLLLDHFPLTPNGKLDLPALPAPAASIFSHSAEYFAARTITEELLCGIWAEVLKVERVGIDDNFFDLGGHSLLATQVISRMRHIFGQGTALRLLFEYPRVRELAQQVERERRETAGVEVKPLRAVAREAAGLPLSYAQQRLWFLAQMEPESSFYNMPAAVRMRGALKIEMLQQALNAVVARHESLRTSFSLLDEQPVQLIAEAVSLSMPLIDLSHLDEAEREAALTRQAEAEAGTGFDLREAPLLRVRMLRLAQDEHVLLLTMHHIISDGWSMGVLVREVGALYEAYERGEESALEELEVQYVDYAVWQRERLKGEELERELGYWREQLRGAPAVLELPTDRVRPPVQSYEGSEQTFTLSAELSDSLQKLSRQHGVTLFMTLLAAWQVLLSRYAGQEDVVVGSPIANRQRIETEGLIGFFVNMLVLRTKIEDGDSFQTLVERVREVCLEAYTHQDVPFEKLVEDLHVERSLSYTPMFQAVFSMQNASKETLELREITLERVDVENRLTKFDLTLSMSETEEHISGSLAYNTAIFDASTIQRMLAHFEQFLQRIVEQPEESLSKLSLLTELEREQILVEWNDTGRAYSSDVCLHHLFEAQAERSPNKVALVDEDRRITYAELNQRSNRLAHHLRALGVAPEVLVGVLMERSEEMIVSLLAILKAGGACVPLDPLYPQERLSFMLEDARARVLITRGDLLETLAGVQETLTAHATEMVNLDSARHDIAQCSSETPQVDVQPANLAYLIYTSGSTGRPKGVALLHRGLSNRILSGQEIYRLQESARVLHKAPFSFDASLWEIFWPLTVGAQLVLARPGGQQDAAYLMQLIKEHELTVVHFVPSMLQVFLEQEGVEQCQSLQHVFCGGEVLGDDLAGRFMRRFKAHLHNQYGPTETSVNVTYWTCEREDQKRIIPIGRPFGNTQIYILDRHQQPTPVGVGGELYIAGDGVSRGYLWRADLTAERFLPNKFSSAPGARMYRSGDVARYRQDGRIEYLGRADEQVKVRGYRIELGEIEVVLSQHMDVRDVVVVAREQGAGGKQLVGYIVPEAQHAPDVSELRRYLEQRLPEYMVPSLFVFLDEFPLSPNGKIDRRALPAPDSLRLEQGELCVAPGTPIEGVLVSIWSQVLGIDGVSIKSNFFEIGGHSLLATQLVSRVREIFKVEMPLRRIFEYPTIEELARCVEQEQRSRSGVDAPPLRRVSREQPLPLSFAQQRLWFLDQLTPDSAFYNIPEAVRLSGRLNLEALERSLAEVIRRHESLRTSFSLLDEQPVQLISPASHSEPSSD